MRVALASHNFPPEFQGGTERVVFALARALAERGEEVIVITGSDAPHAGVDCEREDYEGVPVFRIKRHPDEPYGIEELLRPRVGELVVDLLREHRIEVLHAHHWATLTIDLLRRARDAGVPSVATLHDMWTSCPRFFRRPPDGVVCPEGDGREACGRCVKLDMRTVPLWELQYGLANRDRDLRAELDVASAVCTPSAYTARAITRHTTWGGDIEVVPHGLLEPVADEVDRSAASHQPFRVGTFGNLVPDKGVRLLVEAMAGVDAELHLHGKFLTEEFEAEVHRVAAEAGVRLTCHGPYRAGERHPARTLDLAVFPSLCQETYGLVVEEALARGVPVVVSDGGALGERIGEAGEVVPMGDRAALSEALRRIATDRERHAALRRAIPAEFSTIATSAKRYLELYRGALEVAQ